MVRWSRRARTDLKAIHDYIAREAPIDAKRVASEIVRTAASLANLPHLGRKVPEIDDDSVREISAHSWRILYQLREGDVVVVALIHKRRQPSSDDLRLL